MILSFSFARKPFQGVSIAVTIQECNQLLHLLMHSMERLTCLSSTAFIYGFLCSFTFKEHRMSSLIFLTNIEMCCRGMWLCFTSHITCLGQITTQEQWPDLTLDITLFEVICDKFAFRTVAYYLAALTRSISRILWIIKFEAKMLLCCAKCNKRMGSKVFSFW